MARWRVTARLGWQANRLSPDEVLRSLDSTITDVTLVRSPRRSPFRLVGVDHESAFEGVNRSHWWLVASVA
jgi:hypothetical protein